MASFAFVHPNSTGGARKPPGPKRKKSVKPMASFTSMEKKWPALLATVTKTMGINYGQLLAMDHFLDLVIKECPVNGLMDSVKPTLG